MEPHKITIETGDGITLSGTLYPAEHPRAIAVISGATGVPERFYARFAQWLAAKEGVTALTYTYRDMTNQSPAALRASRTVMSDWGITDGQAARDKAHDLFPDLPQWIIGHSLGGMLVSKQPQLQDLSRAILVASGLVYHRGHPFPYRLLAWLFWFVIGPLATRLMGYLPGRSIGFGDTLPAGVFFQWRRWCTSPNCFLDDPALPKSDWTGCDAPVKIVAMADDQVCTPEMAYRISEAYPGAEIQKITLDPATHRASELGHLKIFSSAGRPYWPDLIAQ